jgi:hypothetical protein
LGMFFGLTTLHVGNCAPGLLAKQVHLAKASWTTPGAIKASSDGAQMISEFDGLIARCSKGFSDRALPFLS